MPTISSITKKEAPFGAPEGSVDIAPASLYIPKKGLSTIENGDIKLYSEENHDSKVEVRVKSYFSRSF